MENSTRAVGSMALATVLFFGMSASVKWVGALPTVQVVFFRAVVALVLCVVQLRLAGVTSWGTLRGLLVARGVFGTMALLMFFWTLQHLPLATATVLQHLSPLFSTAMAIAVLGERLRVLQVFAFALAVSGVAVVNGLGGGGALVPVLVGVGGAMASAVAYVVIGRIGQREHALVIILWFPLVTVPAVLPVLPWVWVWPTPQQWVGLLAIGGFVQAAQYFMTRAFQLGDVSVVSLVNYLGVVWAGLGGWLLFDEALGPRFFGGAALILAGVGLNTWARR